MAQPDPLQLHADAIGDGAAIVIDPAGDSHHDPGVITFSELNREVNRLARAIRALGVAPGERLVWCGPNSPEVLTTIHAARKAGQIAVPLSYRFNAEEMQFVIANSDATLVVVDAEQAATVAEIRDQLPAVRNVVVFGEGSDRGPDGFERWSDVLAA